MEDPCRAYKLKREHLIPFLHQVKDILLKLRDYEQNIMNKDVEHGFVFPAKKPRKSPESSISELI